MDSAEASQDANIVKPREVYLGNSPEMAGHSLVTLKECLLGWRAL